MATQDRSPSLLIGQQWSAWTDLLSSIDTNGDESCTEKVTSDSMKLGKKDMGLFGFCPARDEFTLVVCEKCNLLIKPQALKQHIESRHGPTNLSSLGNVPASALNSELGKKLLMPEPLKSAVSVTSSISTISSHQTSSSSAKTGSSSSRPPTKASLKQVPASSRDMAAPRLGVSMKISPVKGVKSGNRIASSSASGKSKAISSNPVVKVEKLPERLPPPSAPLASTSIADLLSSSAPSSSISNTATTNTTKSLSFLSSASSSTLSSSQKKQSSTVSTLSNKSENSKISTLVNGSLKTAVSLTTPSSMTFSSLFNMSATAPSSLVVTTKTSTDTPINSRSLSTLVTMSTLTKPIMIAPVMTVTSTPSISQLPSQKVASSTSLSSSSTVSGSISATTTSSGKSSKKDHQRPKFLPCKDREYDANKHCGVKTENGKSCTRSLTCKTHALSLRRAVPGRCKSFDDLLKEHKAAKDALIKAKQESQQQQQQLAGGDAPASTPSSTSNRILVSSSPGVAQKGQQRSGVKDIKMVSGGVTLKAAMLASGIPTPSSTTITSPKVIREHTNIFQRFTPTAVLPPSVTVKEETCASSSKHTTTNKPSVSSSGDNLQHTDGGRDPSFLPHHPRPLAICQFGGRLNDKSCYLFSRKTDYVRAAVQSALERQLNPPPHKKLCVESKLPKEAQLLSSSHDPYEFNLIDTSGGNNKPSALSSTLAMSNMVGKPHIKPKSKPPSSPGAAAALSLSQSASTLLSSSPLPPATNANAFSSFSSSGLSSSTTMPSLSVVSSLPLSTSAFPSLSLSSSSLSSSSLAAAIQNSNHPISANQTTSNTKSSNRSTARNREGSHAGKNVDSNSLSAPSSHGHHQTTPGKRKRSGSSSGGGHSNVNINAAGSPSILVAAAASSSINGPMSNTPSISIANTSGLTLNAVGDLAQHQQQQQQQQQQLGIAGIITSSALGNHQTRNLIAIPSVNLANAAATLNQVGGTAGKIATAASAGGVAMTGGNSVQKNNSVYKDINLFVTGIDSSSLVNGQYVNITSAQLAELAASQGQTLVLNNFNPSTNNSNNTAANNVGLTTPLSSQTLVGGTAAAIANTGSTGTTPKPSKRSRSGSNRSSLHASSNISSSTNSPVVASNKQQASAAAALASHHHHPLEGFKLIPSNNVIAGPNAAAAISSNTVLMDGGTAGLPVFTSVTLAPGVSPTLVAITSSSAGGAVCHNNNNNDVITGNASQMVCGDAAGGGQFTNAVLSNGLVGNPLHDKNVSNRHHTSSSSKSFIQQQQHHQQQQQQKTGQPTLALGSVLQGSSSVSAGSTGGVSTPAQLAANHTTLFKPGSTFNLTKSVGGKLTVQPVSLTFPIVNQQSLAALTSATTKSHHHHHHHLQQQQQQQQQPQQQQHTLLVAASNAGDVMMQDSSNVHLAGKTDLHLQAQLSNAAPGNVIS